MTRWALIALAALAATGCPRGSGNKKKNELAPGKLGDACKPEGAYTKGSCLEGLYCTGGVPEGYCWSFCPCDAGGTCVDSAEMGEFCQKTCTQDTECRKGYVCDTQWNTCTVAGVLAPKPPMCDPKDARPPKKTFSKSSQLAPSELGRYSLNPTTALDKSGEIVTAFAAGSDIGDPNSLGTTQISRGAMQPAKEVKFDRDNHWYPSIAADRKGTLYLTYLGFNGGVTPGTNVMVGLTRSADGTNWSAPVPAHDPNDCPGTDGCLDRPFVVVGPDRENEQKDVVYVFYYSVAGEMLKVTRSTDGGRTFAPSAKVGLGTYANATVTPKGKLHVVYVNAPKDANKWGDKRTAIEWTNSADGGTTFVPPTKVSDPNENVPSYFVSPQIIVDVDPKRGKLYVLYVAGDTDGRWDLMIAGSADQGQTWKRTRVNDDSSCGNHMVPTAVLDPESGRVHVTWFDNRTGEGSLAYTSCVYGKDGPKCAANEVVSDKPFASYGFGRYSPKWMGEYNSLLLDDAKHTLHAAWTQTVEEEGNPVSRVFYASAKLK